MTIYDILCGAEPADRTEETEIEPCYNGEKSDDDYERGRDNE
jgi:hypothetical protein